jgi:oligoribonuclease NrnB/cAMP/cGMP phosphodiesterase (DHH superfamily)
MDPLNEGVTDNTGIPPLVIYHNNCMDGYASAWCFYVSDDSYEFMPGKYQDGLFESQLQSGKFDDRDIYLVDFSYPLEMMKALLYRANKVTVLDHHKTAIFNLRLLYEHSNLDITNCTTDLSGCGICWKYLNPNETMPMVLQHIQDRDLWKFELDGTRDVCEVLNSIPDMSYQRLHEFMLKADSESTKTAGAALLMAKANRMSFAMRRVEGLVDENGNKYLLVNATSDISELGELMCKVTNTKNDSPAYAMIWYIDNDTVKVSLRSIGDFDVSAIALKYGGGGHQNAAGYQLPLADFKY